MTVLDKLTIIVPTRGRVDRQFTLRTLPPELRRRVVAVCPADEQAALKQKIKELGYKGVRVVARPPALENRTIGAIRQWCIQQVRTPFFLFMDDDVTRFCFRARPDNPTIPKRDTHTKFDPRVVLPTAPAHIVVAGIEEFVTLCREKYVLGGLMCRQFNPQNWTIDGIRENFRVWAVWGGRTAWFRKHVRLDKYRFKEDFHAILTALTRGYKTFAMGHICFDTKEGSYNAVGGCSDFRRSLGDDYSKAEAEEFAKYWPDFVQIRERKYKTNQTRYEVVVKWQQAYASSQRKKEGD